MNRDTKETQKQINPKIVDVAYGATSGAAVGAGIGVAAAVFTSARTAAILPIVAAAVAGGCGALLAVGTMTKRADIKENNSSKSEK